jgi:hypothetical protein
VRAEKFRQESEATLPARDRARDLSGDVGVRAAKAFYVRCGDVHTDGGRRTNAAHCNAESSIASARERQDRLGSRFARNSESAWSKRKVGRRRDHAASRECCEPIQLDTAKKVAESAGNISRERLEGLRDSHVREPQHQLPEHVVKLFAAGSRVGKGLVITLAKPAPLMPSAFVLARARSVVLPKSSRLFGNSSRSVILSGRNVIGISRH